MRQFVNLFLLVVSCIFIQPVELISLGPAVPTSSPVKWTIEHNCPDGQFLYGGVFKINDKDKHLAEFELLCHADPTDVEPEDGCQDFAFGYQAESILHIGIVVLEIDCGRGQWYTVFEQRERVDQQCSDKVRAQPQFRCQVGYALCGIQISDKSIDNIQMKCCELPETYKKLGMPDVTNVNGKSYEVLSPVPIQPNDTRTWGEPKFCPGAALAHSVYAKDGNGRVSSEFDLLCGVKQNLKPPGCPWLMTGVQVRTFVLVQKISIGCFDWSWVDVFPGFQRNETSKLHRKYRCSSGSAVCGTAVLDDEFERSFRLFCCPIPKDLKPCIARVFNEQIRGIKKTGLTSVRLDTRLDYVDFNIGTNPLVKKVLKLVQDELGKDDKLPTNYEPKSKRILKTELNGNRIDEYQLMARCGQFEFRLDKTKMLTAGDCPLMKKERVLDCSCSKELKKRNCKVEWLLYALADGTNLVYAGLGQVSRVVARTEKGVVNLGLVKRPKEFDGMDLTRYENWNSSETIGYHQSIGLLVCDTYAKISSLRAFDLTSRTKTFRASYKEGENIFYFQLQAKCDGFEIRLETLEAIRITRKADFTDVALGDCRIPVLQRLSEETLRKKCYQKE